MILLPAFLFLSALVLPFIPGAMGLFSDSAGPWFQKITESLFFASLVFAYPVTLVCTRLVTDEMFLTPGYYLVFAVYAALWVFLLRAMFRFFERRAGKVP